MTIEEAKKLKVGDKVKIINRRGRFWNSEGKMDKWINKIMTIQEILVGGVFRMKEDPRWFFSNEDIAELVKKSSNRKTFAIAVRIKGGATTVYLPNGKQATVVCDKEDEYDEYTGIKMALAKAYSAEEKDLSKPAEKKPETFSGKAMCISNPNGAGLLGDGKFYEVGKIYSFKNGNDTVNDYSLEKGCVEDQLVMPFAAGNVIFCAVKE